MSKRIVKSSSPSSWPRGGAREAWPCGKSPLFWMTSRRAFSRKAFPTWKPPNRALAGSPGTMRPSASSRPSVPGISRYFCRTTEVVPALIAGNTVVLKPSFYTPLTVLRVAELVRDILPAGILNVVTGGDNVGPWMTSHPEADKISFTGSTQTGRRVFESVSQTLKHLTLELGGNDAGIVLPDVDVDAAIAPIFWGMFLVNGQGCITIKRLLVHESRYDEGAAALSKFAAEQVLGDGFDPATTIGPIQNRAQLLRLQATWAAIQKDGVAVLYRGDEIEGKGNFFPVTILDNPSPHADDVKLENFGPLRSLIKYGTIDEAIEIANSTDYGLGGSVWGRDPAELDAVAHRMEAGTVWINQHLVVNPNVPFGGNKDSGFGVQYGAEGLKEYCYLRVISAKT